MNVREIVVSRPQEAILRSTAQVNLQLAGAGSGKSHNGGLLSGDFIINYSHVRGFIGANTYGQLTKSTLDRIFKVWFETFGWINGVHYVVDKIPPANFKMVGQKLKSYENTISFNNGCLIFTASLDNYKVIDGTEFGWAILDETKDTREEAVKEVILMRLRQVGMWSDESGVIFTDRALVQRLNKSGKNIKGWNPLYILTSPAKVDWINEWFELEEDEAEIAERVFSETDFYQKRKGDKFVAISSTYHNEHNLPEGFIEAKKEQYLGSPHLIDMLIYGFPFGKSGGEFFSQFDRGKHVKEALFLPEENIHISLDFNVVPYITMTCWQITLKDKKYHVRAFDEICLSSPKNNTEDLCKEFSLRWCYNKKPAGLFYYGDKSGKNQSTVSKKHNFDILEDVLRKYLNDNSDRVVKALPSVVGSRDFVNKALAGGFQMEIIIDPKCKNLIKDLTYLKEGPDGGKLIQHATDEISGAKFEKYGHTSDTMRYFLVSAFSGLYKPE